MGKVCARLLWALAVLVWGSSCQARCTSTAGFLSSQQFDQLAFEYEEHRTLGVLLGYQYDIKCADSDAIPIWYYDGEEVTDSTSAAVHQILEAPNTKILKFSKFSAYEVGEYTCSKPCGNFTVDISTGNPVINFDLKSRTEPILSAARILLSYALMGDPPPTSDSVTWYHNGQKLTFPNPLGVIVIDSGLLITSTFTKNHAGDYTATVTSAAGNGSDSFHLNIEFFPVASLFVKCSDCSQSDTSHDAYTLGLQSSVNITCNNTASNDLNSLEFTWKKDNLPLSGDEYSVTHISQGASTLMFEIANFTDAGVYKCLIANSVGSSNKIVHINVLYPPVISRVSPQQVTWVSGKDGRLQVLFEGGFPEPNVIWTRQLTDSLQQETLPASSNKFLYSGLHSLNLTVTSVTPTDAGNYLVIVFNYLGNVALWFTVDVIDNISSAFEEFLPTSTFQVEKESVSYNSSSASIMSSVIAMISTSKSPVASVITTPTTFANATSGTSLALTFAYSTVVFVIIIILVILLVVGVVMLVKRINSKV